MKDTIRLSRRNKDRLTFYDSEDGNKAIERVLDAYDSLQVRTKTIEEFKALPNAHGFQTGATYATSAQPVSQSVLPLDYWKTFDTHVETAIQKYAGRGY